MSTRHLSQFRRLCGVGLCVVLVAGLNTPIASGETPEERCKRETEAYNRAWKDAWIRNHPREVAKGEQPPSPTPPYRCFGHDTPQQDMPGYTPPPGAAVPPAGGGIPPAPPVLLGVLVGKGLPRGFFPNPPTPSIPPLPGPGPTTHTDPPTRTHGLAAATTHPPPPLRLLGETVSPMPPAME